MEGGAKACSRKTGKFNGDCAFEPGLRTVDSADHSNFADTFGEIRRRQDGIFQSFSFII